MTNLENIEQFFFGHSAGQHPNLWPNYIVIMQIVYCGKSIFNYENAVSYKVLMLGAIT